MAQNTKEHCYLHTNKMVLRLIILISVHLATCSEQHESNPQMENPSVSWPDPNRERDRRQVGLGSLSHDGSHGGDHGDNRKNQLSVSDGTNLSISSPSRNRDELAPRRQYPDRNYNRYQGQNSDFRNNRPSNDPSSSFRQQARQSSNNQNFDGTFSYDPYGPNQRNSSYSNRGRVIDKPESKRLVTTKRSAQLKDSRKDSTKDPFSDPDRYRVPQLEQAADNVRFVNGRPYRKDIQQNIQDRYGNRYDPRFHSIPGEYDPENDPRFSDPRYQDPRNLPKYQNNRHRVPQDRYDSKYRYYERFPERQKDRFRDPNYDPRYDTDDPKAPGVLGGWLPELQGQCRPGCENLPRDVSINTNYGRVNGFLVYLYDGPRVPEFDRPGVANVDKIKGKVSVFLGIPYAQPPTGNARLMPPRPHRGWQVLDAVDWAPVCPQPIRFVGATKNAPSMDEDCLYLNIYTPTVQSKTSQLYPVMFYIHGGEFEHGSGNEFPGHQLAYGGQVVVVTFNYRLGALGFLSTGDQHSPGNYGLLDMAMALKWVYDNVNSFQGDRERITVFGPGAGAASGGLLAVMPRSRSMVRRVAAISGSPLADWAAINDKFRAMNTSMVYGERIGCTIESSWKLVDCVRKGRSFGELANIEFKPEIGTWPWSPVVQLNISVPDDEWFEEWTSDDFVALPERVDVAYENEHYNPKLQYLTGVARDDASYMIYNNKTLAPRYDIGWEFFDTMVRDHIVQYNYTLNPEGIFGAIKYMYTYYPDPNNRSHIREEFINFWSDYFFRAPQDNIVKTLVRNRVDTYVYVQNTTVEALRLPWWRQITHNLEHYFLSGAPFMDKVFFPEGQQVSRHLWTEGDRNMSEFFIHALSNFSWYGNPTPKNILGVHWDMATNGEILKYLAVNTTENSTTLWNYRQRECAFWTEYLPTVIGYITPTYPPTTEFWWEPDSPIQVAFWSMSSACLFLLVLVVICCLLWRNAKRQSQDRYFDGTESLKGFPDASEFESQHLTGGVLPMETTSMHRQDFDGTDLASHQQQMMTGTRSLQQTPYAIHGSTVGLGALPPQTPIPMTPLPSMASNQVRPVGIVNVPNTGMNVNMAASTHTIPAIHPMSQQQPQAYVMPMNTGAPTQPLPPTPNMEFRPVQPLPSNGMPSMQNHMGGDSLMKRPITPTSTFSGQTWQLQNDPTQQRLISSSNRNVQNSPQSEHTSGRGTNESNSDSSYGGQGRATPPLKPLGLPKSNIKLVPGRMAPSSGGNISSTAV